MRKNLPLLVSAFLLLIVTAGYSQTATKLGNTVNKRAHIKWKMNPFDKQVFIENKGQFDGELPGGQKVYYVVRLGTIQAFFTANGIVYKMTKYPKIDVSKGQDPDKNGEYKPTIKYLYSDWKNAKNGVTIVAGEEQSSYYTYPVGNSGTIKTNIYKKITYSNVYPGIDIEYSFKKGKPGIEYKLIVHPGADISVAKLLYSNGINSSKIIANGDIEAKTEMGSFNMSAPLGSYADDNSPLKVSYALNGNEESFSVVNPNPSKTYIIDPWVTNPLFTTDDRAYDLDYDNHGNVYVYGGDASPYQLVKMNSAGAIQWTFNATLLTSSTNYYGDFAIDRVTAEAYLVEGWRSSAGGARAEKVNTLGALMATFGGNNELGEMYRAEYDACNRDIVVGGGGTSQPYQACVLDTSMISINPVNIESVATGYHDIALLTIDPSGSTCYMATTQSLSFIPVQNNYILKLPLPALIPAVYDLYDGLSFHEIGSVHYTAGTDNGFNGMAASPNWLYLYNGDTLRQVNKNTGALNKMTPLNRHLFDYHWGGLDVDACDDIYIGYRDSIKIFNSSLEPQDSLSVNDTVFDLHLGQKNIMYACGINFVSAINVPSPPSLISSATGTPSSCSACDGTATVNVNCGIAPYSYLWSNGNTTISASNLCAGSYTVTVTDAACPPATDTAVVVVSGEAGYSATIASTSPNCTSGGGHASVNPVGGNPPYTYSWSTGATTQSITGLSAGTYCCTITDLNGCRYALCTILSNANAPDIKIAPPLDSICSGGSIGLVASGGKTYTWLPNTGLTCYNCTSPLASPTGTVTYTVTGTDSNGCSATATATIKVTTTPKPIISGPDSTCVGTTIILNVNNTAGTSYVWTPTAATTTSISILGSSTQTYTIQASKGGCTHDTTKTLTVVPDPTASITNSKDSVCSGDSLTLEGSSGLKYVWQPGNLTGSKVVVRPGGTTTYTLYTYASTCKDSTTVKIKVIQLITANAVAEPDSICPGQFSTLTATVTGGQATYLWSPGGYTNSSVNVNPTSTQVYTVTVTGECNTKLENTTVIVVPYPKPVINGTDWKCKGIRDTLFVTGGTKYIWSNGNTTTTYKTGPINNDSTISVTAFNVLGCSHDTTFTIDLRLKPTVSVDPVDTFCAGQPIVLQANGGGVPLPSSYSWNTGQTGSSITIDPGPDSSTTYIVTASNGCKASASATATPNFPMLNSCCSQTLIEEQTPIVTGDTTILYAVGNSIGYVWAESPTNGTVTCLNPPLCDSVQVIAPVTTTYTVTGTDKKGCTTDQVVIVTVEVPCFNIIVPNVITPSMPGPEGLNSMFYIKTENIDAWSIIIFDRWGKEMFTTTNQYQYWTGTTEGGGQAPDGVYYYIIKGTCQNTTYKKDGFIQLIR